MFKNFFKITLIFFVITGVFSFNSHAKFGFLKKAFKVVKNPLLPRLSKPLAVVFTEQAIKPVKKVQNLINNGSIYGDNFQTVEKGQLYRSAQLFPWRLKRYIKRYDIKTLVNLRGEQLHHVEWWRKEKAVAEECGTKFYNIPMSACEMTTQENLATLLEIYSTAPRPILIHCYAGADRTGEAAAIWKLDQQGATKKEALKQLSFFVGGHNKYKYPLKDLLIKNWQGREWVMNEYNHEDYI